MYNDLMSIFLQLDDIKEYVESFLFYNNHKNDYLDYDEILMYLSSIPEIVENIKERILEIYEKETI